MAYRYKLPSGAVVEADTPNEMKTLLEGLLKDANGLSKLQSPSAAGIVRPDPQQTSAADSTPNTFIEIKPVLNESTALSSGTIPSVDDFCSLWREIRLEAQREILRMFAKGNNKLSIKELEKRLKEKCNEPTCNGSMRGIGRIFHRVSNLTWKDYFVKNKGVYEVNKAAHKNLVSALEIVEPEP